MLCVMNQLLIHSVFPGDLFSTFILPLRSLFERKDKVDHYSESVWKFLCLYFRCFSHSPDLYESGRSYTRNRLQWKFPEFGPIHCNSKGIGVYIRNECHSLSRPLKAILIFLNEPPSPLALEHWYSTAKLQTSGRDFAVGCMFPQITSEQTHAKAAEKYHCQEPGSAKVNTSFIKKNVIVGF